MFSGVKDSVNVVQPNCKREHIKKRLVLANLKEIHASFKQQFPDTEL